MCNSYSLCATQMKANFVLLLITQCWTRTEMCLKYRNKDTIDTVTLLKPNYYFITSDMKDEFLHVPVAAEYRAIYGLSLRIFSKMRFTFLYIGNYPQCCLVLYPCLQSKTNLHSCELFWLLDLSHVINKLSGEKYTRQKKSCTLGVFWFKK